MADTPTVTPAASTNPQLWARVGGAFYLVIIVAGAFGEAFVRQRLVVPGDAAATAANIQAAQGLWRAGIAGDLLMHVCDVPVMAVIYLLLRPVSRPLALTALLFNIVQTGALVMNKMTLMMPLFLLGNAAYLKTFGAEQLAALAYVFVRAHGIGFGFGLVYFGAYCLVVGHLVRRSGFLPAVLGWGMQLAGACYIVNTFTVLLWPKFGASLYPYILVPAFVAELSFALWLLIKGVNVERWRARAAT